MFKKFHKMYLLLNLIAIILAIPSFLLLFFTDKQVFGILGLFMVFLFILTYWYLSLPAFSALSISWRYEFNQNAQVDEVKAEKEIVIRPWSKGIREYHHRNISADGEITDFWVHPGTHEERQYVHKYIICHRFPLDLDRFKKVTLRCGYRLLNSFPQSDERIFYIVDHPCRHAKIEVIFPPHRVPIEIKVYHQVGIDVKEIGGLAWAPDSNKVVWERSKIFPKLPVGSEVRLEWTWRS